MRWALAGLLAAACGWPLAVQAQQPGEVPAIPPGILEPQFRARPLDDTLRGLRLEREAAPALERYAAGDYPAAARLGLQVLAAAPEMHSLRFAVANSLAWSGSYEPAIEQYRALLGTPYDTGARVGMANVMRWRGQADLAEPHYRAVLEREPANEDARTGLRLAARELRPALTARIAQTADIADLRRRELALGYRQWSADRAWRFDFATRGEEHDSPVRDWSAREVQAAAWAVGLPWSPRAELSIYDSGLTGTDAFGTLQLEPVRDRVRVRAGRVNWGRLAFNAEAANDGLTAATVGLFAQGESGLGALRARFDAYDISDGNTVLDGELQLTPAWQPLPWRLGWLVGVYHRVAQREDPRYWSPDPAYGLLFLGLQRGWYSDRAELNVSVRRGFAYTDTARNSWSAGLNGRYWLSEDVAVGAEAWASQSPRPAPYSIYQVALFVQHLW